MIRLDFILFPFLIFPLSVDPYHSFFIDVFEIVEGHTVCFISRGVFLRRGPKHNVDETTLYSFFD